MVTVRPASARGRAEHGWLHSRHTFSFADYFDPRHMGFRVLRVINEDVVEPGAGFGRHGHRDMEILSWVLGGGLKHGDSIGTGSVIRPGQMQRMSAGTGVLHSEMNASTDEPVHFLQIWIEPARRGVAPSYEQKDVPPEERRDRLRLCASPDGAEGSVTIHQDARLYVADLSRGARVAHPLASGRHAWVQVARGNVVVNGAALASGDGAAISDEAKVEIEGAGEDKAAEVLLFDLP